MQVNLIISEITWRETLFDIYKRHKLNNHASVISPLKTSVSKLNESMDFIVTHQTEDINQNDLIIIGFSDYHELKDQVQIIIQMQKQSPNWKIILGIGFSEFQNYYTGIVLDPGNNFFPLNHISIRGSGMYSINLVQDISTILNNEEVPEEKKLSRTSGALGSTEILNRLQNLRIGIVGVGRMGTLIVSNLLSLGVKDFTLIDNDFVEEHNLGESEFFTKSDIGKSKVEAVSDSISIRNREILINAVKGSVTQWKSLRAIKTVDMLFVTVDNEAARRNAGWLASLYCIPLIDIGTGIYNKNNIRDIGFDVRMILPNQSCCICFGDSENKDNGDAEVESNESSKDWQQERAGSLKSLNQLAAATAQRLLEDLVQEVINQSTYIQFNWNHGNISTNKQSLSKPSRPNSCFCQYSGTGDSGINKLNMVGNHSY